AWTRRIRRRGLGSPAGERQQGQNAGSWVPHRPVGAAPEIRPGRHRQRRRIRHRRAPADQFRQAGDEMARAGVREADRRIAALTRAPREISFYLSNKRSWLAPTRTDRKSTRLNSSHVEI